MVLLAGDFITLWVGPGFELSGAVVRILVGPITLALALYCCDTMLLGIGRHRVIGLVSLGEALVVIALGWPLISRYGVLGGAMASAGALLLVRPWLVPAYTCRIAGLGLGRFWWRGPLKAVVALAPAVGLSFWILSGWPADTWLRLAVVGALYSALCLPGAWFIALDDSERDFWKRMLGDLWERLPGARPAKIVEMAKMIRAKVWLTCAAMHDPVSPVLVAPSRIGWDAKHRQVDLVIDRPLKGSELLARMKGWVTVDVAKANEIFAAHGRLKLLDERELVVECEDQAAHDRLVEALAAEFGDQVNLEPM